MVSDHKAASLEAGETGVHALSVESGRRKAGLKPRKADVAQALVRALCVATSTTAVVLMVTASESSTVSIYGFPLPVSSKWSFSDSFE